MTTTWRSEQRTTIPRRREITVVLFGARFILSWYSAPPGTTYRKRIDGAVLHVARNN
jgi:hypothetical protein